MYWAIKESIDQYQSTESNSIEIAKALLEAKADTNIKNEAKKTPLHETALRGRVREAQVLIDYGTDVNAKDELGLTPLHHAAMAGARDIIAFLVANGAEVNITNNEGYTPLHWVVCANIWIHQVQRYIETAEILIRLGANLEAKTDGGKTPLAVAQEQNPGRPQLADLLKSHGAR